MFVKSKHLSLFFLMLVATNRVVAQGWEAKLNLAAGAVAIFNTSIEAGFNDRSALTIDYVGSFAEESYLGSGYPLIISMGTFGYRYYLNKSDSRGGASRFEGTRRKGFFVSGDFALTLYRMSKNVIPLVSDNGRSSGYDVGYGYILGVTAGYKYPIARRLNIEASISGGWQNSRHEGYTQDGSRYFTFNTTAEWTLYKGGVYISYMFGLHSSH